MKQQNILFTLGQQITPMLPIPLLRKAVGRFASCQKTNKNYHEKKVFVFNPITYITT
jgi:hypothetical protein